MNARVRSEAHLSGFLLLKHRSAKEDSNIFKKGTQAASQVGEKCKILVASAPTPWGGGGAFWNLHLYPTRSYETPQPPMKLHPLSLTHHISLLPGLLASNLPSFGPLVHLLHATLPEGFLHSHLSPPIVPQGPWDRIQASESGILGPTTFAANPSSCGISRDIPLPVLCNTLPPAIPELVSTPFSSLESQPKCLFPQEEVGALESEYLDSNPSSNTSYLL